MGYDKAVAEHIRSLLLTSGTASARLYALSQWAPRLIPSWLRSPRWLPVVGWLMTVTAALACGLGLLGAAMDGVYLDDDNVTFELAGMSMANAILLLSSTVTLAFSLPAMVSLRRTDKMWPLHFLRYGALTFTMLNALVDFATEGFAALVNLSVGLFTLAVISYQIDVRARMARPRAHEEALAASTPAPG